MAELVTRLWSPARVDLVCDKLRAGKTFLEIADDVKSSRSAIAGLVGRLKAASDPRLPEKRNLRHKTDGNRALDEFAEHLSESDTVQTAARRMGISDKLAYLYFAKIRKNLGRQAR